MHEQYDKIRVNNDIALLKLKTPIRFNRNVKPICLPDKDLFGDPICVATGWGKTQSKNPRVACFSCVLLCCAVFPHNC